MIEEVYCQLAFIKRGPGYVCPSVAIMPEGADQPTWVDLEPGTSMAYREGIDAMTEQIGLVDATLCAAAMTEQIGLIDATLCAVAKTVKWVSSGVRETALKPVPRDVMSHYHQAGRLPEEGDYILYKGGAL